MEGVRCLVECWADFGDLLAATVIHHGPDVILSTGTEDVCVFSGQEKRVKVTGGNLSLCCCVLQC